MLIKALLPLIAVFKFKCDSHHGQHFGQEVAQAYKACKKEINLPQSTEKVAQKAD